MDFLDILKKLKLKKIKNSSKISEKLNFNLSFYNLKVAFSLLVQKCATDRGITGEVRLHTRSSEEPLGFE